ncbi:MAG: hypothetical protein M5U34_07190 [Chloroflexi bacterium]|nr:hypothetical protein [Chloroflexota bacterium]
MLAVADQGGVGDVAKLYDSGEAGVDVWAAEYDLGRTRSTMSSPTRLLYEVLAFDQVGGYGFNGGLGSDFRNESQGPCRGNRFRLPAGLLGRRRQTIGPGPEPSTPKTTLT